MSLALKVLKYVGTGIPDYVILGVIPGGSSYVNGTGDTLNLNPSTYSDPNGIGILGEPLSQPTTPPSIEEEALSGYYGALIPGTTLATNVMKFYQPGGTEISSGAYPSQISGGTLTIRVPLR